ncbi:hypothetical protein BVRB_6g139830 [Beta vulgaris subsp. vulgaris]|nr:hypothetical protein BVRB_6g139830 [Beta vulgaris subsp. vulgaris]
MGSEKESSCFPGFQKYDPKDEYVPIRRALMSRLQKRAPRPLQLKSSVSFKSEGTPKLVLEAALASASTPSSAAAAAVAAAASSLTSLYQNKDPIPLLSPLVSPSYVEKSSFIHNEINTAKSR